MGGEKSLGSSALALVQAVNLISLVSTNTRFVYVSSFNYVVSFYGLGTTGSRLGSLLSSVQGSRRVTPYPTFRIPAI